MEKHSCTNIVPVNKCGIMVCQSCGLGIKKSVRKPGTWHHFIETPAEKPCSDCGETKDIEEFYKRSDALDGYNRRCKVCMRSDTASTSRNKQQKGMTRRSLWFPIPTWNAAKKLASLRGEKVQDFVVRALQAEVERRARELMDEQTRNKISQLRESA